MRLPRPVPALPRRGAAAAALAGLSALACSGGTSTETTPVLDRGRLPLLGDNAIHLYAQEAYEGFSPAIEGAVAGRYDELVTAGMDTARHLFDWSDLEPMPGVYDIALVEDEMDRRLALGIRHQFCNVVVVDSGGPVVPAYIEAAVASGVPWDDPLIADALADMLDAVLPSMVQRGAIMIGLSNEPSGYFEDEPAEAAPLPGLIARGVEEIHRADPGLAATVVFAGPDDLALDVLMPLCDVASFNLYPYELELEPGCLLGGAPLGLWRSTGPGTVGPLLDRAIAASGDRLVCIQEFGQSTGWDDMPQSLGPLAGLANQADVFTALRAELDARRDRFRLVCAWTLNDHTPAGMEYLRAPMIAAGLPPCFADNVAEIFGPTGLVRSDATASEKPAFAVFRDAISALGP